MSESFVMFMMVFVLFWSSRERRLLPLERASNVRELPETWFVAVAEQSEAQHKRKR